MSERSHQWHIHLQQSTLLQMVQEYWWERACAVDILDIQEDEHEREQFEEERRKNSLNRRLPDDLYLVSPPDSTGWTTVWPENAATWDNDLWVHLSWKAHTSLLAGYCSSAGWEHWAWFQDGFCQTEHWSFADGTVSVFQRDRNKRPTGDMNLDAAFAVFGRTYYHRSNSLARVNWAGLPIQDYKLLLTRCDWNWRFSVPEIDRSSPDPSLLKSRRRSASHKKKGRAFPNC